MISLNDFKNLVSRILLDQNLSDNTAQDDSISHSSDEILVIVAGPGSGKTTVLVLRALRHVFVDDVLPEEMVITTFTRKAARELRTRWLDWGARLWNELAQNPDFQPQLNRIDLNRCRIDTLDSIAQQALSENRLPGEVAPIVVEKAAAKLILKRWAFNHSYRQNKAVLDPLFLRYAFSNQRFITHGEALSTAKTLCERLIQDRVDLQRYAQLGAAQFEIVNILQEYLNRQQETNVLDFAGLELRFLERLGNGILNDWLEEIRVLLIDEYQDTNPLQEAIYFNIINSSQPMVTIVGDDDQAMYRFRGGSVELFTEFGRRCLTATGRSSRRIDMIVNYRSSEEIVAFYNAHIVGDRDFEPARIIPRKPEVASSRGSLRMPVLGLFAPDPVTLANRLAAWLDNLLRNRSVQIATQQGDVELRLAQRGNLGDAVLLSHSIEEVKYDHFNSAAEPRFPNHLRVAMRQHHLHLFNPRGRKLRTIQSVQQLLGLLLLCLDPEGALWTNMQPTNEARFFLTEWTAAAQQLIIADPNPNNNGGLREFIRRWQAVSRGQHDENFPDEWPALRLLFKLITWIPGFQTDPEHQVWLEAITRTISSAGMASAYGMQILNNGIHRERSRQSFIRDALFALAEDEIEVDEDIMPSVPRNMLQLMTIHQAKGLQFPLVIVDVGSHFSRNNHLQAFLRFPRNASNVALMEDDVEEFLQSPLRGGRTPLDRSFDDLTRLYYVAYSRPQSVLMLVGHENCLRFGAGRNLTGAIPNIALGWCRNNSWLWRQPFVGRQTPIQVDTPFTLL